MPKFKILDLEKKEYTRGFSGILFIQNGSIKCANEWNKTEISIDHLLARG